MTKAERARDLVERLPESGPVAVVWMEMLRAILDALEDRPSGPEPDPEIAHLPRRE